MQAKTPSKTVLVGFFDVPGFGPDVVETPIAGKPSEQYSRLLTAIRARHPSADPKAIIKKGSIIETRTGENSFIEMFPGQTLSQLFRDDDGAPEAFLEIGRVFFCGSPGNIRLIFSRASGAVMIHIMPLLRNDSVVRFSNKISPQRQASELPKLIEEVLGKDARKLELRLRPSVAAK